MHFDNCSVQYNNTSCILGIAYYFKHLLFKNKFKKMQKYSLIILLIIGFMSNLFSQTNNQIDSSTTNQKEKMVSVNSAQTQTKGKIIIEPHGAILVARIDGGPHAVLDQEI